MGKVSVVMPARNAAATIRDAIESVLASPEVHELIVIDDQSTDMTAARVQEFGDDRVRIVSGEGKGISAALNLGFGAANAAYIARCDADDLFPSDRFDWQLEWLCHHPEFDAVSGGFQSMTARGKAVAVLACNGAGREVTEELRSGRAISHFCAWLVRRSALRAVSGARPWFETAEDLDLMYRLAGKGRVWHEPRVAYFYRLHDASITHSTANNRRIFFEAAASAFAAQRCAKGVDDLDLGRPPELPVADDRPKISAGQIEGQIIGAIWSEWNLGRRRVAIRKSLASLGLRPASAAIWRTFAVMMIKYLARR